MAGARHREFKKLKRQISEARIQQMQAQRVQPVFNKNNPQSETALSGFFGIEKLDTSLPDGKIAKGAVHEFMPASTADFPAALGFMICFLRRLIHLEPATDEPILWCHTLSRTEFPSLPYLPGLSISGIPALRFLTVNTRFEKDMLWALEEGLSMARNPLIVGVNSDREKIYDFTASRRLSLRANRQNSRLLLLRPHTNTINSEQGSTTSAATRWQISPHPSQPVMYRNSRTPAMGSPRWHVTLTRCKGGKTGNWILEWNHETFSFHLASPLADRKSPAQPQQTNDTAFTPGASHFSQTGS
jgi:protein ImuA